MGWEGEWRGRWAGGRTGAVREARPAPGPSEPILRPCTHPHHEHKGPPGPPTPLCVGVGVHDRVQRGVRETARECPHGHAVREAKGGRIGRGRGGEWPGVQLAGGQGVGPPAVGAAGRGGHVGRAAIGRGPHMCCVPAVQALGWVGIEWTADVGAWYAPGPRPGLHAPPGPAAKHSAKRRRTTTRKWSNRRAGGGGGASDPSRVRRCCVHSRWVGRKGAAGGDGGGEEVGGGRRVGQAGRRARQDARGLAANVPTAVATPFKQNLKLQSLPPDGHAGLPSLRLAAARRPVPPTRRLRTPFGTSVPRG